MTTRVLVIGAAGQLGRAMVAEWPHADSRITACSRADLDATSWHDVRQALNAIRPHLVINCAAYTDVEAAETSPLAALAVNAWAPEVLARGAREFDAALVHFSTDFVFDGVTDQPYTEADSPNPQSAYAASKLLGEWFVPSVPRHYVLRVESLFGGVKAQSSIDRLLQGLRAGTPVRAFVDRAVSPSYVSDVVAATAALVDGHAPAGTYHCVNSGWTTWSTLAREIARLVDVPGSLVTDVRMADVGLKASRPKFAALANDKLTTAGIVMPPWQDALARYVRCA